MIERVGVWLPTGFEYVAGSSNLENLSVPVPSAGYRCTPTVYAFRNGTAIVWDYVASYGSPIDYSKLPLDKSGTATSYTLNHLRDTVNNQFSTSDVGRSIWDATDDQWGVITAYNSTSDLTLASNLFDSGDVGNRYGIGEANRRVVSFSFTPSGDLPDGAFCWVSSPGNDTPAVSPYLWWSEDKLYQITSTGEDPVTGETTTLIVYTTKEELREFGASVAADYEATGNTLIRDHDGEGYYRERVYQDTPAQMTSILAGAHVEQIRLYWSGWKNYPWNAWPLSDAQRSALVSQNFVDRVHLKVEVSGVVYETTVIADAWQVQAHGTSSNPRGWNYSCYADVTEEVSAYFAAQGITFNGNATYTLGHADTSAAVTETLQGVWGSSSSDVFTAGASGSILHYDGSGWSQMTSGTTADLYDVWGSSASDVFAVGEGGIILHYDGTAWSLMTSGTSNTLYGVWGSAANNVFAVGSSGTIRRYDGSSWTAMTSGTTRRLYDVWGSDASNVFAVGERRTVQKYSGSGNSWTQIDYSSSAGTLYGVWGSAANNVYVVGASGMIRRYNGSSWTAMTSGTSNTLYGVWGSASNNVYAVGNNGTIRRYVSSWSGVTSGTSAQLNGVWGSSASDIFVVGASGSIRHYDGSAWSSMIGDYSLYEWNASHSGETVTATTDYPLGNTTEYGTSNLHQAAYAAWSVVVLYTHPELKGHQLYLYDTFRYCDWDQTLLFNIENFLAPQDVLTDPNAARMTIFVGEGDDAITGERVSVNGTYLSGGLPYACNPVSNVFNSKSSVVGTSNIGIDIDTFAVAYPIIQPGDTAAVVSLSTEQDTWTLIYIILSFRSEITSGGINSIKIE
jgi:hypothetical protein